MAIGGNYFTIPGIVATGDLSSNQYYIVKAGSTAGTVKVGATAATDPVLGVLQNDPTSGQAAEVACVGVCKVIAETSVSYGDQLTVSSTGRAKTSTTLPLAHAHLQLLGVPLGTFCSTSSLNALQSSSLLKIVLGKGLKTPEAW